MLLKKEHTKDDEVTIKLKSQFEKLEQKIKSEILLNDIIVYTFSKDGYEHFYGSKLESTMIAERYIAFSNTVVLINPTGLRENEKYKSRLVTQVKIKDCIYLITLSSYNFEAFKGYSEKIIDEILKMQKVGDAI